jgi:hypothetical protein
MWLDKVDKHGQIIEHAWLNKVGMHDQIKWVCAARQNGQAWLGGGEEKKGQLTGFTNSPPHPIDSHSAQFFQVSYLRGTMTFNINSIQMLQELKEISTMHINTKQLILVVANEMQMLTGFAI